MVASLNKLDTSTNVVIEILRPCSTALTVLVHIVLVSTINFLVRLILVLGLLKVI